MNKHLFTFIALISLATASHATFWDNVTDLWDDIADESEIVWEDTKDESDKAWESTKDTSKEIWDDTREALEDKGED